MIAPSFGRPVPVTLRVLLSLGFLLAAVTKFIPSFNWHERFSHPPTVQAVRPVVFLALLTLLFITQQMTPRKTGQAVETA